MHKNNHPGIHHQIGQITTLEKLIRFNEKTHYFMMFHCFLITAAANLLSPLGSYGGGGGGTPVSTPGRARVSSNLRQQRSFESSDSMQSPGGATTGSGLVPGSIFFKKFIARKG